MCGFPHAPQDWQEDGELSSVQEVWAKHVPSKGLPAGDSHSMLCFHDIA